MPLGLFYGSIRFRTRWVFCNANSLTICFFFFGLRNSFLGGFRRRGIAWSTVTAMGSWSSRSRTIGRYVNRCCFLCDVRLCLESASEMFQVSNCAWWWSFMEEKDLPECEICVLLMWCYCFWTWRSGMTHVSACYAGSAWRHNLRPFGVLTSLVGESCVETVLMCF